MAAGIAAGAGIGLATVARRTVRVPRARGRTRRRAFAFRGRAFAFVFVFLRAAFFARARAFGLAFRAFFFRAGAAFLPRFRLDVLRPVAMKPPLLRTVALSIVPVADAVAEFPPPHQEVARRYVPGRTSTTEPPRP